MPPPLLLLILFAARRSLDQTRALILSILVNGVMLLSYSFGRVFPWWLIFLPLRWRPLNFGGTVFVVRYDSHVSSCVSVWIVFVCVWRDVCVCAPRICLVLMCRCGVCAVVWQAGIAVSVPEASRLSHLRVVQ